MNEEIPAVSVVVAAWNAEQWIGRCLESISAQTLKDIEIIAVDDGSTDGTLAAMKAHAEREPRMRILSQPNAGSGIARNAGISLARGRWLSVLDADDEFDPDMLESAMRAGEDADADVVCFTWRSRNLRTGAVIENRGLADWADGVMTPERMENVFQISTPAAWSKLLRRDFVEKRSVRFGCIAACEDVPFSWIAYMEASRIACLRRDLLSYSIYGRNASIARWRPSGSMAEAGRIILDRICRLGRDDLIAPFFNALLPHAAHKLVIIPSRADPAPFIARMLAFVPSKFLAHWRNAFAKRASGLRPAAVQALHRAILIMKRPDVTAAVLVPEGSNPVPVLERLQFQRPAEMETEIVCIAGGPETYAAALSAAKDDPRILVFRKDGAGMAQTARIAGQLARGRTVFAFSADSVPKSPDGLAALHGEAICRQAGRTSPQTVRSKASS